VAPIVVALIIVALALAPAALAMRFSVALTLALSAVLAVLLLVAAQIAFNAGRVLPVVYPLLALVLSAAAVALVEKLRGDVRRQRATSRTSTFPASKQTASRALTMASNGSA
jgi:CHASE2 domain-containing sensor protein